MPVMTKKFLLTGALSMIGTMLAAAPDLTPMPKRYSPRDGFFALENAPLLTSAGNRQARIGAEEIAARVRELGGTPGPIADLKNPSDKGVLVLSFDDPSANALVKLYDLKMSVEDPGPQGYVIHCDLERAIIMGGDKVGALYGAMTFRQMLTRNANGAVGATPAEVYDWPDYRYRSNMSFHRGLMKLAVGEKDPLAALKAGVDWMARFKMNLLSDYYLTQIGAYADSPRDENLIRELNAYAVERGVYPLYTCFTNLGFEKGQSGFDEPGFENWNCVNHQDKYFCWSRRDLAVQRIDKVADFLESCHFKILFLHPVDGGGIGDPELWSRRCPECRKRWKDDERHKASAEQFNLWIDTLKKRLPDLIVSVAIYPYSANYGFRENFSGVDEKIWRQNSVDYWRNMDASIDRRVIPLIWNAPRAMCDRYRENFPGRPLFIFAHSFQSAGYFGGWHCTAKTDFYGDKRDIHYLSFGHFGEWLNVFCSNEYSWNTLAPGNRYFTGSYYDIDSDHEKPEYVFKEWLPRACRAFYGDAIGDLMAPVYQGVLPMYIENPGRAIFLANKKRQSPLSAVDPTNADLAKINADKLPPIVDSADRMEKQVTATDLALASLEKAYPLTATMGPYLKKDFMYFYKRMPLWNAIAKARLAEYRAREWTRAGKRDEATALLLSAERELDRALKHYETAMSSQKNVPDTDSVGVPKNLLALCHTAKTALERRADDAKIRLAPRPAGDIVRVAVYNGLGADITRAFFDRFANAKAEIVDDLSLSVLDRYDCVFMLQATDIGARDYADNLNRYVNERGGGVLFQHDLCGLERSVIGATTPFPEICPRAAGKYSLQGRRAVFADGPLTGKLTPETALRHMYYDHVSPEVGPKGRVAAKDEEGRPVAVYGEQGPGKVVFDGTINFDKNASELKGFNAALTRHAVEWFAGKPLKER